MSVEADSFESEINECICKAQTVIKESMLAKASQSVHVSDSVTPLQQASELNSSSISENNVQFQSCLKPLK